MSSFDDMCQNAVKRFIQTVAIIDDEATYKKTSPFLEGNDETKTAQPPVTGLMTGSRDVNAPVTNGETTEKGSQDDHDRPSQLDAKVVINAFADMGIACCIQCPKHEKDPEGRAVKLAASVDVFVIDWVLDKDNRSLPRDIIKRILEEDKSKGGRMRLIVVYTSHNFVKEMLKDLKEDADNIYKDVLVMEEKHLLIKGDSLRIVFLNKETTVDPPRKDRVVPFDQLPTHIISEYTELMKGVIPGATLHGIAAMRENTHKLLSILNCNLDGAYCLHRALLPEPLDSVDFAMNLITSEIETVIQTDAQARQFVDNNGLKAWFDNYTEKKTMLPYKGSSLGVNTVWKCMDEGQLSDDKGKNALDKEFSLNLVKAKTDKGQVLKDVNGKKITLTDAMELINKNRWENIKRCQPPPVTSFAEVLYNPSGKAIYRCNELSHLQCTARDIGGRLYTDNSQSPTLQLGTILKKRKGGSSEWFLCLTPLCDCVRLEEESNFLFLQLYSGTKSRADIIIKTQNGMFEPLIIKNKKLRTLTIPFKPTNGSDRINAYRWQKEWRVKSNGTSYQWVGELRYTKALAIGHQVMASTSRVGVDEFEWLRRQATLKN